MLKKAHAQTSEVAHCFCLNTGEEKQGWGMTGLKILSLFGHPNEPSLFSSKEAAFSHMTECNTTGQQVENFSLFLF